MAPTELPSSDEQFAIQPTVALATPVPTEPPGEEFPPVLSSGAQTMARMVDQLALAQAAQAAQALLAAQAMGAFNASALRADGTPMPQFRVSYADVRGEELASVVGGHTVSHGAGVAVEPRGHRWTFIVLGMAAVIGVVAAVVIQLAPSERIAPVSGQVSPVARSSEDPPRPVAAASETPARPEARDERERAPQVQPTIPDPPPATPETQDPTTPGGDDPTPDLKATEPLAEAPETDGKAVDGKAVDGKAVDGKAVDGKAVDGKAVDRKTTDGKTTDGKTVDRKTADGKATEGKATDGRTGAAKIGEARSTGRRSAGARDSGKHKGILTVQSTPWSWVTVDVETKETPAKFYLEPGVHTVKLYNEDNGLTKYEKVTIDSDKLYKLNEDMDQ